MRILVIDDDLALGRSLQLRLEAERHMAVHRATGADGLREAEGGAYDLVFLDLKLPDLDGLDILARLSAAGFPAPVVMITAQQEMKSAIEAMKTGAFDYLRKPFEWEDVRRVLEKASALAHPVDLPLALQDGAELEDDRHEIFGRDARMLEIVKSVGLLARSRVAVLIEGESGTGKELVARALHEASTPGAPFVAINCSAVVPTLFESELFGHEKGAFTGADARKTGKMEHARNGTLFLDEVGDLSPELQAKLLRVLQEKVFERVGGLAPIPFAARVVAATHRDLDAMVREGAFRQDLFFRLGVSRLRIPPLRERKADLPLIALKLLARVARAIGRELDGIRQEAMDALVAYDWPGNVRELENVITRAAALSRGRVIGPEDLALVPSTARGDAAAAASDTLGDAVRRHVETVLKMTGWNITRAAGVLEISPTTLRKKISDYKLKPRD